MRNRKPQWTHKETQYLIKEYDKRKIVLRPRKGQLVTAGSKHKAWVEIAQCVNLTNPHVHRTVAEVQKKWQNLCLRTTKAKANVTIDTNNSEKVRRRSNRDDVAEYILNTHPSLHDGMGHDYIEDGQIEHAHLHPHGHPVRIKLEADSDDNTAEDQNGYVLKPSERSHKSNPPGLAYTKSEIPTAQVHEYEDFTSNETDEGEMFIQTGSEPTASMHLNGQSEHWPHSDINGMAEHYTGNGNYDQYQDEAMNSEQNHDIMKFERQKLKIECEKLRIEREQLARDTTKLSNEKANCALELQHIRLNINNFSKPKVGLNKSVEQLQKERLILENEKLTQEIAQLKYQQITEKDRNMMATEKHKLETIKLNLEIQAFRNNI